MILGFTLITILIKLILTIYIGYRIQLKKRETGVEGLEFIKAVMVMLFTLFLSRVFLTVFDYHYTKLDMNLYPYEPQIWFWKIGQVIATLGQAYVVFILDKKLFQFKFKGIISYLMIYGAIMLLIFPVHDLSDFEKISVLSVISMIGIAILPIAFINIALKSSGEIRKTAWMIVWGILLFIIGSIVINASILNALQENFNRSFDVLMFLVQTITKGIGMMMIAYAGTKFNP
jgi:hypothetical protein